MQIERTMCQGFVKLCRGLEELGVLGPPATAVFNTEQERFEQRFGAFQQIYRPEPLGFEHFVQLRKDKGMLIHQEYNCICFSSTNFVFN